MPLHVPFQCTMLSTQPPPLSSPIAIIVSSHDRFRRLPRSTHGSPLLLRASISGRCAFALRSVSHQSAPFRSPQVFCLPVVVCSEVSCRSRNDSSVHSCTPIFPVCLLPHPRYSCTCFIHHYTSMSWPPCIIRPHPPSPFAPVFQSVPTSTGVSRIKRRRSAASRSLERSLPTLQFTYLWPLEFCVM